MVEIVSNVYAIDYINNNDIISSSGMNRKLEFMGIDLKKVIFSTCCDEKTKSTWIVAAVKFYDEKEVEEIIKYMLQYNLYYEYFMGDII